MGEVISINISKEKGTKKIPISNSCKVVEGLGLENDAHSGAWHRQISLLAIESIGKMRKLGLKVGPGDFAENITTLDINLPNLGIGKILQVGKEVVLKVTQIGKECHDRCAIYYQAGDCIMPKEGIFTEVLQGGLIQKGDEIIILEEER